MRIAIGLAACLMGSAVMAQDGVPPVESCEPLYTVQKRQCAVEHVYRCETMDGPVLRYDEWEQADESLSIEVTTVDGDFLAAWNPDGSFLIPSQGDVRQTMSTSDLIETGTNEFDFNVKMQIAGMDEPLDVVINGRSILTGEPIEMEGVKFQPGRTDFQMNAMGQVFDGYEDVLIDMDTLAVVGGEAEFEMGGGDLSTSGAPADLIFQGEDGFLENDARFDCGELSQITPALDEEREKA